MIRKFTFGNPFPTEAVVETYPQKMSLFPTFL